MEAFKHSANIRVIVDADHDLPLATPHKVSHSLVTLKGKIHPVAGRLPVGRIHIVEGMGAVIALGTLKPAQIFNIGAGHTLPRCRKVFLDPKQVDCRTSRRGTECLPRHLAGEGMVRQVEEPSGALDVGESFRAGQIERRRITQRFSTDSGK